MLPFDSLTTPRLLLRPLVAADAPAVLFLRSDPGTMRYIGRPPLHTLAEAGELIDFWNGLLATDAAATWAVARPEAPAALLGTICLWNLQPAHRQGEIGYSLHPGSRGQGLMGEAVEAVVAFGFSVLNLHRIEARLHPDNAASARLLARHGFAREGLLRESYFFNGEFSDTLICARLGP